MLRFEGLEELGHRGLDGGVGEGLLFVLEDEADGILLLVGLDLRATVYVEEADLPQDAADRLERGLAKLGERDTLVEQQRQVAAHLREAGQFLVFDLVALHQFEEHRPVNLGHEHRLLDVKLLEQRLRHRAGHGQAFVAQFVGQALGEEIGGRGLNVKVVEIHLEALQQQLQITLQRKIVAGTQLVAPGLGARTGDHQAKPLLLAVALQIGLRVLGTLFRLVAVAIADLEETQVAVLVVDVARHHLQRIENQRLPHHIQVVAERIDDGHRLLCRIGLELVVVLPFRQRIVHDLHETAVGQQVGDRLAHLLRIGMLRRIDGSLHAHGELNVVVAVDAEHFLHHVAFACHVHAISRNSHDTAARRGRQDLEIQALQNPLVRLSAQLLADEAVHACVIQLNADRLIRLRADLLRRADHGRTGDLLQEQGGAAGSDHRRGGIDAALVAERSVGLETLALRGLSDGHRVEISRLEEHLGGRLGDTGVEAAEHAGNAHRLLRVADHEVVAAKRVLHPVEGRKLAVGRAAAHHHFPAGDLRRVESVERMTHLIEHEVRDVDHAVDRTLADGHQALLQPLGRRAHFDIFERDANVTGCQIGGLHLHGDGRADTGLERAHVGQGPFHGDAILLAVGIQVAGHADVAGAVHAVGRQADLEERIFLQLQLLAGRSAHHGRGIEHHDAGMVVANAQFILRADHAEAFDATDLGALDLELAAVVGGQLGADRSQQHFLPLRHVGSAADDLQELGLTRIEFRDMQVVGIGVRDALDDFRHDDAFQAAGDLLDGLHVFDFKPR